MVHLAHVALYISVIHGISDQNYILLFVTEMLAETQVTNLKSHDLERHLFLLDIKHTLNSIKNATQLCSVFKKCNL